MATIHSKNNQLNNFNCSKALIKLRINNSITGNMEQFTKQNQDDPTP